MHTEPSAPTPDRAWPAATRERGARRARSLVLVVALLLAVVSTACGSSDSAPDQTFTVRGGEQGSGMFLDPSSITVTEGRYRVRFQNIGSMTHELAILDSDRGSIGNISAAVGETATFDVDLEPGSYQMICREMGHAPAGMVGTLTVERAAKDDTAGPGS
jgi:plastocyanin